MSAASALSAYLSACILLALAWAGVWGLSVLARERGLARLALRAAYALTALAVLLPPVFAALGGDALPEITARSLASHPALAAAGGGARVHAVEAARPALRVELPGDAGGPFTALGWLVLFGAVAGAARMAHARRAVTRVLRKSFRVRRIGRVEVRLSPASSVPFAYRSFRRAWVVIPEAVVARGEALMAVRHELQHHRQGDTLWVYFFQFIQAICPFHPAAGGLARRIAEIQEFACDEALVDLKRVSPLAYARCLLEVAQSALSARGLPAGTTGMAAGVRGKTLERRIHRMLENGKSAVGRKKRVSLAFALGIASMMVAAHVSNGAVRDRKVTLEEARAWAQAPASEAGPGAAIGAGEDFPVDVNEEVLKYLNKYVGTPGTREHFREAISRMGRYRELLGRKFEEHSAPDELLAIPLIESSYKNSPPKANPVGAAGLWQFIQLTARNYGLRVDEKTDERLHPERSTDAALRYLKAMNLRFKDWRLAVLAYNVGESKVQKGIERTGSRDPWWLIAKGFDNDRGYLAKVMAGVLILRNPSLLD